LKNSLNLTFSKEQLQAINHFRGPALVIAGPGSGKTSVIANRIINLIQNKNVNPQNILVITFSKMAAVDMQSRFISFFKSINDSSLLGQVSFGTFHSIFFSILKSYYGYSSSNIISNSQKRLYISKILKNLCNESVTDNEYIDSVIRRISYFKNSNYTNDFSEDCQIDFEKFEMILKQYNSILQSQRKVDFEDMMLMCRNILINNIKIREYYQQLFKYILIDEFQDINDLQFEIVKLLLGEEQNLFVVGDDDQAIYGFRGSNPQIMLNLKNEFQHLSIINLSCNYRSTKNIVRIASFLIDENNNRYHKNIYTNNELGEKSSLLGFSGITEENEYILKIINECLYRKMKIGILYRTNSRASLLIELLVRNRIAFSIKEVPINPYESEIFNDFIIYLQISNSKSINVYQLRKIINKPIRYIDTRLLTNCENPIIHLKYLYKDKPYVIKKLDKLLFDLKFIENMDMYSAFHYFRKVIGYEEYIFRRFNNDDRKLKEKMKLFDELSVRLKDIKSYEELIRNVSTFKEEISRNINIDNKLSIMTFHSSKGLEFDTVIIPDINEGIVPNKKALTGEEIEEERRMFYVACTRARHKLHLLYLKGETNEYLPGRFISKLMDKDFVQIKRQPD